MSPNPELEVRPPPSVAIGLESAAPESTRDRRPWGLQRRLWDAMRWASAGGVFLMMLVAFADVVGRKFVGQPLRGSVEITELLMLVVVFIGVSLVSRDRTHVQLDLIDSWVPPRWRGLRERAGEFLAGLVMAGAAWLALTRTLQAAREGELTALLRVPLAPAFAVVATLLAIAAFAHLMLALGPTDDQDRSPP